MKAAERLGSERWSRPGLNNLDVGLADAIGRPHGGYFVELGANDGLQQSNTYLLERELGWTGVLVEALPELAAEAHRNRPGCVVVCAVASSPDSIGTTMPIEARDLTSRVASQGVRSASTTLAAILGDVSDGRVPDLICIDVEGHEMEVLRGLDVHRTRPRWILVETADHAAVTELLDEAYDLAAVLSHHDYLYRRRPPDPGFPGEQGR